MHRKVPAWFQGGVRKRGFPVERHLAAHPILFKAPRRVSLCPWRIGAITAAALALLHIEHDLNHMINPLLERLNGSSRRFRKWD